MAIANAIASPPTIVRPGYLIEHPEAEPQVHSRKTGTALAKTIEHEVRGERHGLAPVAQPRACGAAGAAVAREDLGEIASDGVADVRRQGAFQEAPGETRRE